MVEVVVVWTLLKIAGPKIIDFSLLQLEACKNYQQDQGPFLLFLLVCIPAILAILANPDYPAILPVTPVIPASIFRFFLLLFLLFHHEYL